MKSVTSFLCLFLFSTVPFIFYFPFSFSSTLRVSQSSVCPLHSTLSASLYPFGSSSFNLLNGFSRVDRSSSWLLNVCPDSLWLRFSFGNLGPPTLTQFPLEKVPFPYYLSWATYPDSPSRSLSGQDTQRLRVGPRALLQSHLDFRGRVRTLIWGETNFIGVVS